MAAFGSAYPCCDAGIGVAFIKAKTGSKDRDTGDVKET
jgi:hypothetical protein